MIFSEVVEELKRFPTEEKLEIQLLLQQYLREERRDESYENFQASRAEQENGRLTFSADIDELKQLLEK